MSSTTWTRSGAADAVRPWRGTAERLVENQAESSTRPLVDSAAEHEVLERLLDAAKPPIPDHARRLSFLLATPFRYPPLPWGSRFGTRHQPSIWYGALDRSALFAEAAYYTFVRLEHSPAVVSPHEVRRTSFRAAISARRWIDWTAPRFADLQPRLRHPAASLMSAPRRCVGR